ncbi:MAG TPA: hypothetical protein VJ440_05745 [Candidatus Brocadiaceae bacterium]|nr:hypothetical protein [Candidatus Brocadiaceae bacterium]
MEPSIINNFITTITDGQQGHIHRFYEIFSARGFFLELDKATEIVRLSADSHAEDGGFLEALEDINYKHKYVGSHQDAIIHNDTASAQHALFNTIDTRKYPINDIHYITALFTNEIPVDLFRLNWERDWYGKFEQFKGVDHIPQVRVFDLEPFIARLVKAFSSVGISTWSSCEGHCGEPAYIKFDGKYHRAWCQALFENVIRKKLNLSCSWEWSGWDNRCSIRSHSGNYLELYLEIQSVARFVYTNRDILSTMKTKLCPILTDAHKNMNQKTLLNTFEKHVATFVKVFRPFSV